MHGSLHVTFLALSESMYQHTGCCSGARNAAERQRNAHFIILVSKPKAAIRQAPSNKKYKKLVALVRTPGGRSSFWPLSPTLEGGAKYGTRAARETNRCIQFSSPHARTKSGAPREAQEREARTDTSHDCRRSSSLGALPPVLMNVPTRPATTVTIGGGAPLPDVSQSNPVTTPSAMPRRTSDCACFFRRRAK